jgi:hypothetical protein
LMAWLNDKILVIVVNISGEDQACPDFSDVAIIWL